MTLDSGREMVCSVIPYHQWVYPLFLRDCSIDIWVGSSGISQWLRQFTLKRLVSLHSLPINPKGFVWQRLEYHLSKVVQEILGSCMCTSVNYFPRGHWARSCSSLAAVSAPFAARTLRRCLHSVPPRWLSSHSLAPALTRYTKYSLSCLHLSEIIIVNQNNIWPAHTSLWIWHYSAWYCYNMSNIW